ncbi:hypothetical protein EOPP23_10305 [Endozoicomonas sp. OPT23]|nr:hypothetical protein [Endozoicomonas sp. OPT23]
MYANTQTLSTKQVKSLLFYTFVNGVVNLSRNSRLCLYDRYLAEALRKRQAIQRQEKQYRRVFRMVGRQLHRSIVPTLKACKIPPPIRLNNNCWIEKSLFLLLQNKAERS